MIIKYNASIDKKAIAANLARLINQIYKLLPSREENADWQKLLVTIQEEFAGMDMLLLDHHQILFQLMSKLEGLFTLTQENDFMVFRKTIFECLNLVNDIKVRVEQ